MKTIQIELSVDDRGAVKVRQIDGGVVGPRPEGRAIRVAGGRREWVTPRTAGEAKENG